MIKRRSRAGAHEFFYPDPDRRDAEIIVKVRNETIRHARSSVAALTLNHVRDSRASAKGPYRCSDSWTGETEACEDDASRSPNPPSVASLIQTFEFLNVLVK